ncbi:MAG: hydroxyacid dehydrogenase [Deltaproteobacteria bacterium HGW-Deltaproteobacteria-10]|nr:MAG: hydroxyacid dehydrogenase [Deltaproteobacteria bacterium HGW-Deltaproteobacteria-10]
MNVFFYEAFAEEVKALKGFMGNTITCDYTSMTIQEAGHAYPPAHIISIRTQSVVPAIWANQIDGILSRSTGYDHLLTYLANIQRPLPCGYLEEYATRAVAEQAIMLTMTLLRKLRQQQRQFHTFGRDGLTGGECAGKNLLVVGVGRIGSEIASIAEGIGMNIKGVDIVRQHPHIDYIDKTEGIRWADVVICAMNLTKENAGYFSFDLLRQSKKGIVFINIARGEHSPVADLEKLLREGHLGAIGLDVYENEPAVAFSLRNPAAPQSPEAAIIRRMMDCPNVIFTPHNAFNTMEAVERKARFTMDQIMYFLEHKDFKLKPAL